MTTRELIAKLQRLDPSGKAEVEIAVGSYTKVYPSGYLNLWKVSAGPSSEIRIYVSFPEGYQIREPKI